MNQSGANENRYGKYFKDKKQKGQMFGSERQNDIWRELKISNIWLGFSHCMEATDPD